MSLITHNTLVDNSGNAISATNPLYTGPAFIDGVTDDGTRDGVQRMRLVRGDYVRAPLRDGTWYSEITGGAAVTSSSNQATVGAPNPDGSGFAITVVVPAYTPPAAPNAGAQIWFEFFGRVCGVRFRQDSSASSNPFSATVDGVPYLITPSFTPLNAEVNTTIRTEGIAILVDDLTSDGPHYARLVFPTSPTGSSSWVIYGWVLERRMGYGDLSRLQVVESTVTLTASQVVVPMGGGSNNYANMRGIRKVDYANTSNGVVTVTVQNSGSTWWQKPIAAGDTETFDLGALTALNAGTVTGTITHAASVTGVVNATVVGGI